MSITLAYDPKWKLGIIQTIRNCDFRFPRHGLKLTYSASVHSAVAGGDDYTTITTSSPYNLDALVGVAVSDRLTSYLTLVNAAGQREERLVWGASSHTQIIVQGALSYIYAAGDDMTLMTEAWPAVWESINPFCYSRLYLEGYGNSEGLKLVSFTSIAAQLFSQSLAGLISNTTYELKTYYKLTTTLNQPISLVLSADSADKITLNLQSASVNADWERRSTVGILGPFLDWTSVLFQIRQPVGLSNMGVGNPLRIDSVVLQHASGTAGTGSGSYTFTEFPSSISQSRRNVTKPIYRASGYGSSRKEYGDIGQRRRSIKATFDNVSETFLKNLMVFKSWQDRGYYLCLETPYFDLQPWIIGTMFVDTINKDVANLAVNSLNFTFIEA